MSIAASEEAAEVRPNYRFYTMDSAGRHIIDVDAIWASSDEHAVSEVAIKGIRDPGELWLFGRLVRKFPAARAAQDGASPIYTTP